MSAIQNYTNGLTDDSIQTLVRGGIVPSGTPPEQIALFAETSRRHGLDPFKKQIYLVGYGGKYSVIVGIDGMRSKAARTGLYAGRDDAKFDLSSSGNFKTASELIAHNRLPQTCTVTVYKAIAGMRCPFTKTVAFAEYCPSNKSGKWASMPLNMIEKCAEAAALRVAFSEDVSGMHIEEEIAAMQDVTIQAKDTVQDEKHRVELNRDACKTILYRLNIPDNEYELLRLEVEDAQTIDEIKVAYGKLKRLESQQPVSDPAIQFEERVK